MNVATIAIGFAGASHSDPKVYPLALMKAILGSYTASDGLIKSPASSVVLSIITVLSLDINLIQTDYIFIHEHMCSSINIVILVLVVVLMATQTGMSRECLVILPSPSSSRRRTG